MQAIITKFLPATNTQGDRAKASCQRGSVVVAWDSELTQESMHVHAARLLIGRLVEEDCAKYGTPAKANPWSRRFVSGQLPSGAYAHVYLPGGKS